ncbi:hypothetical protein KS4_05640 [Poriferisphaera corsica]|uniref:Uncharacterized protein n=1 Tax=Poriferisphaera corsica TaxID=2528020 RepID=A0A517YQN2_9BACT|nr:hypothetical protein [Poriferisphaera corsica]QDU32532.1 hypothetical protein KS4_05640 [Poriferisphaera corsica]
MWWFVRLHALIIAAKSNQMIRSAITVARGTLRSSKAQKPVIVAALIHLMSIILQQVGMIRQ